MTAEKVREIRARRAAERQGLTLSKSRRRDVRALDFGTFTLADSRTGEQVAGPLASIEEVETYLNTPRDQRGSGESDDSPDKTAPAGAATPTGA